MAKEMNEFEEMFEEMEPNHVDLFDEMEDEESQGPDYIDEEDDEEMGQNNDDFSNDDADWEEGIDENEDDKSFELEESDEEDEDLFTLKESLRQPKLDEDDYLGMVGKPEAEKEEGKFGPWVKITLPFIIKNPETGEKITVPFVANRSMDPRSRLFPILKGILGAAPTAGFNLKSIEGKRVKVSIEHRMDEKGNVWENVIAVRPFKKKK